MLQKPLLAFGVAFALSAVFSLLSLMLRLGQLTSLSPDAINISATSILTNALFCLAVLASFFGVFYFLATIGQIQSGKAAVIALLMGVLLGRLVIYYLLQFSSILYLNFAGSLATVIFLYFLPAIAALLFAQWRNQRLAAENL
jgi:hypothetical protein